MLEYTKTLCNRAGDPSQALLPSDTDDAERRSSYIYTIQGTIEFKLTIEFPDAIIDKVHEGIKIRETMWG